VGIIPTTPVLVPNAIIDQETTKTQTGDPHLRSCREIRSYHIETPGGDIGHVDDFLMDDRAWQITHLVVNTHHSVGGEKVLIAVSHIQDIEWENHKVVVDLSIDAIVHNTAS
jgi:hypothetical protein